MRRFDSGIVEIVNRVLEYRSQYAGEVVVQSIGYIRAIFRSDMLRPH